MCKENRLEEKYDCPLKYFVVKGLNFKGCIPKTGESMELKFTIMTLYNINRGVGRGGSKGLDEPPFKPRFISKTANYLSSFNDKLFQVENPCLHIRLINLK